MKVKYKLIATLFILVSLIGLIGYLGLIASKHVAESYEGKDDQFRTIVLTATEVSGQIKKLEGQLILYLALNTPFNIEIFSEEYDSLRNQIQAIKQKSTLPQVKEFVDQMEVELETILQQGIFLIKRHNIDLANTGRFKIELYEDQIRSFHTSSSNIRKIGIKLADENTLFLNRQKPITTATEAGSYAKRAEGHLMLFLTLNDPIDRDKFFQRHTSLKERIKILRQLTNHSTAREITDRMEIEAEKILRTGKILIEAYDNDKKIQGYFQIQKHKQLILDFSSATSLVHEYSHMVMLHNIDWETNKIKTARTQAASIQMNIIVLVIFCVFSASLLGYILYRPITRSIEKLKSMSAEIGKGNLDIQSEIETNDEFAELGVSFNQMCEALKSSRDELLSAKDMAENANQAKSQFLTRMSHEFRTPLNAIIGFAQLLETDSDEPLNSGQKEKIEQILRSGWHLLDLVNDLLDLAAIEANRVSLHTEAINLFEHIQDCIDSIKPLAQEYGITIYNMINECSCQSVQADPVRLKQILLNLLSNAVKYNHSGGSVTVSCEQPEPGTVRVNITDTGIGIPETDIADLFEPFSQLYLNTYAREGTGIGLSISRQLIECMGGHIGVTSKLDQGSTFWIELQNG